MKQSTALQILKQGHCVFLTGQAGSGKTYLLNQYIRYLREHHIGVAITASTGIASTHMNGMTIHSWSGIGIKDALEVSDFKRLQDKDGFVERIKSVQVLIIDEVSMLHARQLDLVDEVLRHFRQDERAFGGLQVVLSGDFFQLPPIGVKGETNKDKFAFMSKVWIHLANSKKEGVPTLKICYLHEQHRQKGSPNTEHSLTLSAILNQIRTQSVSQQAIETLLTTKHHAIDDNCTRLYTHNSNVDNINQEELAKLAAKEHIYEALTDGDKQLVETLKKSVRAPKTLTLKVGAKVMFVKNSTTNEIYNGMLGEVVGFVKVDDKPVRLPQIKLGDGRQLVVHFEEWRIDDEEGAPLATYSQLPLCLAWAMTVHKSQGMTLTAAKIDLSKTFELGQGYVALSRVKSLAGLKLLGLNHKSLLLDEFARAADRRFLALSDECESWLDGLGDKDIKLAQKQFIKRCGGFDAPKPTKNPLKTSTHQTLALIKEGKTINEMAANRSLAKSTIIEHIKTLIEQNQLKSKDIAYLAPDSQITDKVAKAVDKLQTLGEFKDGIRLRPLYDELRQALDYETIRLCLLFI